MLQAELKHVQNLISNVTRVLSCLNRMNAIIKDLNDIISVAELDKSQLQTALPHFGCGDYEIQEEDHLPVVFAGTPATDKKKKKGAKRAVAKKAEPKKGKKGVKKELQFSDDDDEADDDDTVPHIKVDRAESDDEDSVAESNQEEGQVTRGKGAKGGRSNTVTPRPKTSTLLSVGPGVKIGGGLLKHLRQEAASECASSHAPSESGDVPVKKRRKK